MLVGGWWSWQAKPASSQAVRDCLLRATAHENLVLPLDLAGHEPKATWAGPSGGGRSPSGGGSCERSGEIRGETLANSHRQQDEEQASKWKQEVKEAKQEVKRPRRRSRRPRPSLKRKQALAPPRPGTSKLFCLCYPLGLQRSGTAGQRNDKGTVGGGRADSNMLVPVPSV